ncbi:MAG: hypothetical protein NTX12_08050 [Actinobacteria bacterium]|nr:hypothetical protein [Actinomycetota bacterium]
MGSWQHVWIASLEMPPWIERKIHLKHGVSTRDIRQLLVCNASLLGTHVSNVEHGSRMLVYVEISERKYLIAYVDLLSSDYSAWSIRTARITSQIPMLGR